eukprot:321886_1
MPKKRRNGGKCRHNRGSCRHVHCDISGAIVPKDKAIIKYRTIPIAHASAQKDLKDASYYDRYMIPRVRYKSYVCISSAVHRRLVKCRAKKDRKSTNEFHLKVKQKRRRQNEVIQKYRREKATKFIIQQKIIAKKLKKLDTDNRRPTKYLMNNPEYMNIVMNS